MRIPERRSRSRYSASAIMDRPSFVRTRSASACAALGRGEQHDAILGAQLLLLELNAFDLLVRSERQVSLQLYKTLFDLVVPRPQPFNLSPRPVFACHADLLHASGPPIR